MSRIDDLTAELPFTFIIFFSINIIIYLYDFIFEDDLVRYCSFNSMLIWKHSQYYRIVTSCFFHGGLQHIALNMFSFYSLGISLEKAFGSFRMLFVQIALILFSGAIHFIIETSMMLLFNSKFSSAVGYSGVIFGLAVIESFCSMEESRNLFGLFNINTRLYPIILMILIQFLMPNISFLGHLSGIIAGFLVVEKLLYFMIPSVDKTHRIEENVPKITKLYHYIKCPTFDNLIDHRGTLKDITNYIKKYFKSCKDCIANSINTRRGSNNQEYMPVPTSPVTVETNTTTTNINSIDTNMNNIDIEKSHIFPGEGRKLNG